MTQTARKARAARRIDVLVESELWKGSGDAEPVVRRAIDEAVHPVNTGGGAAIVLTDDSAIRLLNRNWRDVDAARPRMLSFPTGRTGGDPLLIGDVVLAYETIAAEARAEGKPFAHHVAHLAVHGFLHLLGLTTSRKKAMEASGNALSATSAAACDP